MTSRFPIFFLVVLILGAADAHAETGYLSMYSDQYQGRPTASGELYEVRALTGSHASLPLGTMVRVANFETGRMVDVRINDRKREDTTLLHLSRAAAKHLGLEAGRMAQGSMMVLSNAPAVQPTGNMVAPTQAGIIPGPSVIDEPAKKRFEPFKGFKRDPMLDAVNEPQNINKISNGQVQSAQAQGSQVKRGLFGKVKPVKYGIPAAQYDPLAAAQAQANQVGSQVPGAVNATPSDLIPLNAGSTIAPPLAMSPAPRPSAPAQAQVPYRVQFGAFRGSSNAYDLNGALVRDGVGTTVIQSRANGLFLVVTQGGFPTADEAQRWINHEAARRGWRERPVVIR